MQSHQNGSVVLLDEVEKAHPEVLDLFLPCFGARDAPVATATSPQDQLDITRAFFVQMRVTSQTLGVFDTSASRRCL